MQETWRFAREFREAQGTYSSVPTGVSSIGCCRRRACWVGISRSVWCYEGARRLPVYRRVSADVLAWSKYPLQSASSSGLSRIPSGIGSRLKIVIFKSACPSKVFQTRFVSWKTSRNLTWGTASPLRSFQKILAVLRGFVGLILDTAQPFALFQNRWASLVTWRSWILRTANPCFLCQRRLLDSKKFYWTTTTTRLYIWCRIWNLDVSAGSTQCRVRFDRYISAQIQLHLASKNTCIRVIKTA